MLSNCFENIDLLGTKFHFYSGKSQAKKTCAGGLLTILIFILSFFVIYIFGKNFFTRKNPTITMSIENDLKYEFFDLKKEKILFAFRIEDYDGNYINVSQILYFKIYYYKTEVNEKGEFRKIISDEFLSYHICNESDFDEKNLSDEFGILFCPELGGKQFGGYWDSPNLYYFEIQVFFCENGAKVSKNNNCTSIEILRNFLNQDDPKFFAFYYPIIEFNPLSYSHPIKKRYKNLYYILSHRLQRNDDVFLKKTIISDNKGWLFDKYHNISFWGVDSFKSTYSYYSDNDLMIEGTSSKIYEINLYTTMEKNLYTRYYLKVQNIIGMIGSLINFIYFCCARMSHMIGESLLKLEIIKNNFHIEDKKKKKEIDIKVYQRKNTYDTKILSFDKNNNKVRNDFKYESLKNNKNTVQSNIFLLSYHEKENYNLNNKKGIKIKKNKTEKKINSTDEINIYLRHYKDFNNDNFNFNKTNNENQKFKLKRLKSQPIYPKNKKKSMSSFYEKTENMKMYFLVCCYNKQFYSRYFNKKNASLFHWYYIYLMQFNRYLEIMKQFDFIKKIILNDNQIYSLLFLKKIDLKNEKERDKLMSIRFNINENTVINYFKNLFKIGNVKGDDLFIYENLDERIQKSILS